MTNSTPATQGFAVRLDSTETAEVELTMNGTVERHAVGLRPRAAEERALGDLVSGIRRIEE